MSKLVDKYNKSPFANIGAKVTSMREKTTQQVEPIENTSVLDGSFEDVIIKPYKTILDNHTKLGDIIVNPKMALLDLFSSFNKQTPVELGTESKVLTYQSRYGQIETVVDTPEKVGIELGIVNAFENTTSTGFTAFARQGNTEYIYNVIPPVNTVQREFEKTVQEIQLMRETLQKNTIDVLPMNDTLEKPVVDVLPMNVTPTKQTVNIIDMPDTPEKSIIDVVEIPDTPEKSVVDILPMPEIAEKPVQEISILPDTPVKEGTDVAPLIFISDKEASLNLLKTDNINNFSFVSDKENSLNSVVTDDIRTFPFISDKELSLESLVTDDILDFPFVSNKEASLTDLTTDNILTFPFISDKEASLDLLVVDDILPFPFISNKEASLNLLTTDDILDFPFISDKESSLESLVTDDIRTFPFVSNKEDSLIQLTTDDILDFPFISNKVDSLDIVITDDILDFPFVSDKEVSLGSLVTDDIRTFPFVSDKEASLINLTTDNILSFPFVSDKIDSLNIVITDDILEFPFVSNKEASLVSLVTDDIKAFPFVSDKEASLNDLVTDDIRIFPFESDKENSLNNLSTDDIRTFPFESDKEASLESLVTDDILTFPLESDKEISLESLVTDDIRTFPFVSDKEASLDIVITDDIIEFPFVSDKESSLGSLVTDDIRTFPFVSDKEESLNVVITDDILTFPFVSDKEASLESLVTDDIIEFPFVSDKEGRDWSIVNTITDIHAKGFTANAPFGVTQFILPGGLDIIKTDDITEFPFVSDKESSLVDLKTDDLSIVDWMVNTYADGFTKNALQLETQFKDAAFNYSPIDTKWNDNYKSNITTFNIDNLSTTNPPGSPVNAFDLQKTYTFGGFTVKDPYADILNTEYNTGAVKDEQFWVNQSTGEKHSGFALSLRGGSLFQYLVWSTTNLVNSFPGGQIAYSIMDALIPGGISQAITEGGIFNTVKAPIDTIRGIPVGLHRFAIENLPLWGPVGALGEIIGNLRSIPNHPQLVLDAYGAGEFIDSSFGEFNDVLPRIPDSEVDRKHQTYKIVDYYLGTRFKATKANPDTANTGLPLTPDLGPVGNLIYSAIFGKSDQEELMKNLAEAGIKYSKSKGFYDQLITTYSTNPYVGKYALNGYDMEFVYNREALQTRFSDNFGSALAYLYSDVENKGDTTPLIRNKQSETKNALILKQASSLSDRRLFRFVEVGGKDFYQEHTVRREPGHDNVTSTTINHTGTSDVNSVTWIEQDFNIKDNLKALETQTVYTDDNYSVITDPDYETSHPGVRTQSFNGIGFANKLRKHLKEMDKGEKILDDRGFPSNQNKRTDMKNARDMMLMDSISDASNPNSGKVDVYEDDDLIDFYFEDVSSHTSKSIIIPFRAVITNYSDDTSANWNGVEYVGRPDKAWIYQGFDRKINLSFDVAIGSKAELLTSWRKLNYLSGMCYPVEYPGNVSMKAPIMTLTMGDLVNRTYVILNNFSFSLDGNSIWEIEQNYQMPMYVKVSTSFTMLFDDVPFAKSNHFAQGQTWIKPAIYQHTPGNTPSETFGSFDNKVHLRHDKFGHLHYIKDSGDGTSTVQDDQDPDSYSGDEI